MYSVINCKKCGREISAEAEVCPHCNWSCEDGRPKRAPCRKCKTLLEVNKYAICPVCSCDNPNGYLNKEKQKHIVYSILAPAALNIVSYIIASTNNDPLTNRYWLYINFTFWWIFICSGIYTIAMIGKFIFAKNR